MPRVLSRVGQLVVLLSVPACAQVRGPSQLANALTARVDSIFATFDRTDGPGCAVGIYRDGRITYARGYGLADAEHGVPITPSTVFGLASVSKQFTAAAIVLLEQQGRLSFDDHVRAYVPELADFGTRVTIRHLIHHTAGLRFFAGASARNDVLHMAGQLDSLSFPPGTRHRYSNFGYELLALVVERASGRTIRDFSRQELFEPLGMTSTFFRDDAGEVIRNIAYEYLPREEGGFRRVSSGVPGVARITGAGGLFSTVEDLARWDRNFVEDAIGGRGLMGRLQVPGRLNDGTPLTYAFGLRVEEYRGLGVVRHDGEGDGYRTAFARFPEQRFSVAVLCNGGAAVGDAGPLADRVAEVYLQRAFRSRTPTSPIPVEPVVELSAEQLARLAGMYWSRERQDRHRIFFDTGKLWLELPDRYNRDRPGGPYELEALSETRFRRAGNSGFVRGLRLEWNFDPADRGPSWVLVSRLPSSGPGTRFERIEEFSPSPEELAEYDGLYVGDEVTILFRIHSDGDRLLLSRVGLGEKALVPVFRDAFLVPYSEHAPYSYLNAAWLLEFRRGASGRIAGAVFSDRRGSFPFRRWSGFR